MDNAERRIQELLVELQECRADQRNNDNIIIQTVAVVASVLSIVSGVSYLSNGNILQTQLFSPDYANTAEGIKKIIYSSFEFFTPARIFFYISCLAFCATFGYISVRGVKATMLYYYIQNIEDRLNTLINCKSDDEGRGQFIHFDDYYSPISTLNYNHLSSSYSMWHYITILSIVICAIGCSLGFVFLQYLSIQALYWTDTFALFITVVTMLFTLFMFLRTTKNAHNIFQFSIDTAHENVKARLESKPTNQYCEAAQFLRRFKYFLFPRKSEWYKCLITASGYITACYCNKIDFKMPELVLLLFIFEFLLYGARYQINDVRGIGEDAKINLHRLTSKSDIAYNSVPTQAIDNSLTVAFFKILVAIICTIIIAWNDRRTLFLCYLMLLLSTLIYESIKQLNINCNLSDWAVFFAVGTGYPIRFVTGFLLARKTFQIIDVDTHFVFFLLSILFTGIFATLLSWAQRILTVVNEQASEDTLWDQKTWDSAKNSFGGISRFQSIIKELEKEGGYCHGRYELRKRSKKFFPISPWSIFYCLSIVTNALSVFIAYKCDNVFPFTILLMYIIFLLFIFASGDALLVLSLISVPLLIVIAFSSVLYVRVFFFELIVILITYTFLRFQPFLIIMIIIKRCNLSAIKKLLIGEENPYWSNKFDSD